MSFTPGNFVIDTQVPPQVWRVIANNAIGPSVDCNLAGGDINAPTTNLLNSSVTSWVDPLTTSSELDGVTN